MKKILFLFLAACFFFSCEKETIVIPQQHAGRTVLAFFWADNSLNSSLRDNIQTMMQGLQAMKDSAALLVYLIQSDAIYLTVNRLTRIRMRCGQRIRN